MNGHQPNPEVLSLLPSEGQRQDAKKHSSNAADDIPGRGLGETTSECIADLVCRGVRGVHADHEKNDADDKDDDSKDARLAHPQDATRSHRGVPLLLVESAGVKKPLYDD